MTKKKPVNKKLKSHAARPLGAILDKNIFPEPMSGCWLWIGDRNEKGYGRIKVNGKTQKVHRIIYQLKYGNISSAILVCHKCDNPSCVNPDHLFSGSHKDNSDDKIKKGRGSDQKRENNANAKLSENDVYYIRNSADKDVVLANIYGVHKSHIQKIRRAERW